jgi:hypothetical protein
MDFEWQGRLDLSSAFGPYYDKTCIDYSYEKFYVHTVAKVVVSGFRRARQKKNEAA